MTKVILTSVFSGGQSKTTTATNLSAIAAQNGHKVLMIDLDPQVHVQKSFRKLDDDFPKDTPDILDLLIEGTASPDTLKAAILPATSDESLQLDLILGSPYIAGLKDLLNPNSLIDEKYVLNTLLNQIKKLYDYDYVFLDSSPTANLLTQNAIIAADDAIIPITYDEKGMYSLESTLDTFYKWNDSLIKLDRKPVNIAGIIPVQTHPKEKTYQNTRNRIITDPALQELTILPEVKSRTAFRRLMQESDTNKYGVMALAEDSSYTEHKQYYEKIYKGLGY